MKQFRVCFTICTSVLLLVLVFSCFSLAQTKQVQTEVSPGGAMRVWEMKVRQGMGLEFEHFLRSDVIPLMKNAGLPELTVWKTEQFGDPSRYFLASPMPDMAQLDTPLPILKLLGPEGLSVLMARMQRLLESTRSFAAERLPNLTIAPKPGYEIKLAVMVRNDVAPGRQQEFEKSSKEIMDVVAKTNAKGYLTSRLVLGGNPNQYITLVLFDSFADLGKFGPAFTKVLATSKLSPEAGIVLHREYDVIRRIPELQIAPSAQPAAK